MRTDQIALIIAGYGALLSTFLFIQKLLKEKRKISIVLEHIAFYTRVQVIITNTGHRPITLTHMKMRVGVGDEDAEIGEPVPQNALIDEELNEKTFPVTISDGESLAILLSSVVSQMLLENNFRTRLIVYDSEGHEYTKFKTRTYNPKWGGYSNKH